MLRSLMANGAPLIVALGLCSMFGMAEHAEAAVWAWSYSGEGFAASGTVTASDTPDAGGFVPITAISGNRNGVLIVGLQPTGTAIPGNDGFPVDNLVTAARPHLTSKGIGYQLGDGTFVNAFFADFLTPKTYLEFFSNPVMGTHTELPITFNTEVPAPAGLLPMVVGLFGLVTIARRQENSPYSK